MQIDDRKKNNIHNVALLVKELIGNRSIRRTAEDSGVAASYISGILNEKYLPSAEILNRLTAISAKPQNAISLQALMIAAGYQEQYFEDGTSFIPSTDSKNTIEVSYKEVQRQKINSLNEQKRFENISTGIILKSLANKGIEFSMINRERSINGFRPDLQVTLLNNSIKNWIFEFKFFNNEGWEINHDLQVRRILGNFIFLSLESQSKVSLVINDIDYFDYIVGFKNKLSFRGNLSVILIDENTYSIKKEEYLSHWNLNDNDSDIFL